MCLNNFAFCHVDQIVTSQPVTFVPYTFYQILNFLGVLYGLNLFDVQVGLPLWLSDVFPNALVQRDFFVFTKTSIVREHLWDSLQEGQQIRLRAEDDLIK